MDKSTHHVPAPHTAQPVKRRRIENRHESSHDENNSQDEQGRQDKRRTSRPFEMIYSDLSGMHLSRHWQRPIIT